MFITLFAIILFVGIFLFLFWQKLKEDYVATQIFTSASYVMFFALVCFCIAYIVNPKAWFWLEVIGCIGGLAVAVKRQRIRPTEIMEAFVAATLPVFTGINIIYYLKPGLFEFIFIPILLVILNIIFLFLKSHYKKFTWYKSGRVGFASLAILIIFFLSRTILAIFFDNVLSFWLDKEFYLSAFLTTLCLGGLYKLSIKSV